MAPKADESVRVYGAGILLNNLQALQAEIDGVRQARDIEFIHRMRVASRRLRSALTIFEGCLPASKRERWINEIQGVTRALGAARDLDVQIELVRNFEKSLADPVNRPGARRLLLRLSQRRVRRQAKVIQALEVLEANQTIPKMGAKLIPLDGQRDKIYLFSPALYQLSFDVNSVQLDNLLAFDAIAGNVDEVEAHHAMRIAAKKLRYSLEAFAPLYENELKEPLSVLRNIQDALGEIHDCDVWAAFLPQFINDESQRTQQYFGSLKTMKRLIPGLLFFEQNRHQSRLDNFQSFSSQWQTLKDNGHWQVVRDLLQTPFNLNKAKEASATPYVA